MRPGFKINVIREGQGAKDITRNINLRLLEITVQDQVDMINDRLTIHLDDRKPYIDLPFQGEKLEVFLGYLRAQNHFYDKGMAIKKMGTYVIDELEMTKGGRGREVAITAHAWDTESPFKQQRRESYSETNIAAIVTKIAQRNGFAPAVEKAVGEIYVWQEEQTDMADCAFLDRLAGRWGCEFKVLDNRLFFALKGNISTLTDLITDTVQIDDADVLDCHYLTQGRGRYTAIRAKYRDKDKGLEFVVETEKDEKAARKEVYFTLPETFPDKPSAEAAAKAKKEAFEKSQATLSFQCVGTPLLMADGEVELTNFRPDIPATWKLSKVTHRLTRGGYVCDCEAEINLPHKRKPRAQNPNQLRPIR